MSTQSLLDPSNRTLGNEYNEALRRGELLVQELWSGPGMLTSSGAARILKVTRQTLYRRCKAGQVLGVVADTKVMRFPSWQFDPDVLPYLPVIIKNLGSCGPWGVYLFFTQKEPLLAEENPLLALKGKKAEDVMRVAKILGDERG